VELVRAVFLLILYGLIALPAEALGSAKDPRSIVESASITWSVSLPDGYTIASVTPYESGITILGRSQDSSVAITYDWGGKSHFRIARKDLGSVEDPFNPGIGIACASGDGRILVIGHSGEEELAYYRVFRMNGEEVFHVLTEAQLEPSPGGRYFCLRSTGLYDGPMEVLDSTGQRVLSVIPTGLWQAAFPSDNVVVVAWGDSVAAYDLPSGNIRWKQQSGISDGAVAPTIRFAPADSCVVLFNYESIAAVSNSGLLRWTRKFEDVVVDVAVDGLGAQIVALTYNVGAREGRFVLLSLLSNEVISETALSKSLASTVRHDFPIMWLRRGLVFQWISLNGSLSNLSGLDSCKTLVADMFGAGTDTAQSVQGLLFPAAPYSLRAGEFMRIMPDLKSIQAIDFTLPR
jgi:hypothetical protein